MSQHDDRAKLNQGLKSAYSSQKAEWRNDEVESIWHRGSAVAAGRRGASGQPGARAGSISGFQPPMGYEFMNRQITYHQFNAMK